MRIFLAGATGVIGTRLTPLLVESGHEVAGMTRSPAKADHVRALGAQPVICDALDPDAVHQVVTAFAPDLIIDQLTDLPTDRARIGEHRQAHDRIRRDGIRNLLAATGDTPVRVISQSVAWTLQGDAQAAVEEHEQLVLDAAGVILRYGQLYGPGTFYEDQAPDPPRIHIDEVARRTLDALNAPGGTILTLTE